jgi:hypothetical protein
VYAPDVRIPAMVVISSWRADDKPPSRLDIARELVAVWVVHIHRSYRLIRGA